MHYDLSRFINAHRSAFSQALSEIKKGRKTSHWMWYIFPQIKGLGHSETSLFYAIKDLGEAQAFLAHDYLGSNLQEITNALMELDTNDPYAVFAHDAVKLHSSMTLFAVASEDGSVFRKVIDKYFNGVLDQKTLRILSKA